MDNFIKIFFVAFIIVFSPFHLMAQKKQYSAIDTTIIKSMEDSNKKFDIEYFEKNKEYDILTLIKEDGTKIEQFLDWECYIEEETPPSPKLYMIQRKYYLNGNLKSKGIFLPGYLPVGIWRTYDEQGNVTEENMDENYGEFDYNKVLLFLDSKGHINLKTGKGRDEITIGVDKEKHCWDVNVWPRESNNYKGFEYLLDLDTGKVKKKGKILPSGS